MTKHQRAERKRILKIGTVLGKKAYDETKKRYVELNGFSWHKGRKNKMGTRTFRGGSTLPAELAAQIRGFQRKGKEIEPSAKRLKLEI